LLNGQDNRTSENQYSGYKNSGVSAIYIGLMLASIAEAVTVHIAAHFQGAK
jgi:hypothetical protein